MELEAKRKLKKKYLDKLKPLTDKLKKLTPENCSIKEATSLREQFKKLKQEYSNAVAKARERDPDYYMGYYRTLNWNWEYSRFDKGWQLEHKIVNHRLTKLKQAMLKRMKERKLTMRGRFDCAMVLAAVASVEDKDILSNVEGGNLSFQKGCILDFLTWVYNSSPKKKKNR